MLRKIVVASDSFKESLSSAAVADAVERAYRKVFGDAGMVVKLPVADGGEGTMQALVSSLDGEWVEAIVHDPLMRPISVRYGIIQNHTAIIEMAAASGLPLLLPEERNPMQTTTYGFGELIADALQRGCRKFLLGIGGSATNDAGIGMLQALGFRFLDKNGITIAPCGCALAAIKTIDSSNVLSALAEAEFQVACDVSNPFSGANGAAHIFAPQKGATPEMVECLDAGLKHFSKLVNQELAINLEIIAGAGAAGGLGGALVAFLQAQLLPGVDMVLDLIGFDNQIADADLIITGEGKLDAQTAMGKAPQGVLRRALQKNIPVIALAGLVEDAAYLNSLGFSAVFSIQPYPVTLEKALQPEFASSNVEQTAIQIFRTIKQFGQ